MSSPSYFREKPYNITLEAGRVLITSPAFDTYWRFASQRQALFMQRVAGNPPPWTNDQVLASHRFTNVYRASDRVSQYLIRHVIYNGLHSNDEVVFRILLFKIFNRIETWNVLEDNLGQLTWKTFAFERYAKILDAVLADGQRIYSAAYIMPSPAFGDARKHRNHLKLLEFMMRDGVATKVNKAKALADVFNILVNYRSLGDFLAFQFTIDLNYSEVVNFSEMDFVIAGPGARDGIRKCFIDTAGLSEADIIRIMAEHAEYEFKRLNLKFQNLWGRPLQLIDCQNLFCELSKYARVVHPEIIGESNRTRIKQKYVPKLTPVPQWYPPKWGLNIPLSLQNSQSNIITKRQPRQQKLEFMIGSNP
ncbi:MAG: hypothetical protein JW841_10565 [Deltaproteobacteria bacterium]|nr:hypothetical protein [Deltaproteobacteria bacterium]